MPKLRKRYNPLRYRPPTSAEIKANLDKPAVRLGRQIVAAIEASGVSAEDVAHELLCLLVSINAGDEGDHDIRKGVKITRQMLNAYAKQRYFVHIDGERADAVIDAQTNQPVKPASVN